MNIFDLAKDSRDLNDIPIISAASLPKSVVSISVGLLVFHPT